MKNILEYFLRFFFIAILIFIGYFLYDSTRPLHIGNQNNHFDGKKFHNYNPSEGIFSLSDVGRWQFYEFKDEIKKLWPKFIDDFIYDKNKIESSVDYEKTKITFINHATFLIQTDRINILTDPLFAKRASPFKWVGPERYRHPGIKLEDLPKIDYITISHDHYDHCDAGAIKYLQDKYNTIVIAGLGMQKFLSNFGVEVRELDWWQSISERDIKFTFVPAVHWSGRYGVVGNNRTLWGGFVISSSAGNTYFSGDTAYGTGNIFQMIKSRFKDIQFAILPIGAYEPRWFMQTHHINPEEAVLIHKVLNPAHSIAAHFGCFALSMEGEGQPEQDLRSSMRKHQIASDKFLVIHHGESVTEGPSQ